MTRYGLTVYDSTMRFALFRETCAGEVPRVGDLITTHPDGDTTLTSVVTGVQRVLRPQVDAPGTPRSDCYVERFIGVTARVES